MGEGGKPFPFPSVAGRSQQVQTICSLHTPSGGPRWESKASWGGAWSKVLEALQVLQEESGRRKNEKKKKKNPFYKNTIWCCMGFSIIWDFCSCPVAFPLCLDKGRLCSSFTVQTKFESCGSHHTVQEVPTNYWESIWFRKFWTVYLLF